MLKNQKGMSLAEVLAGVALLSLILLLGSSVFLFGQKQAINQTAQVQNQADVRLGLNIITKEIRKASSVNVNSNVLTINDTDIYKLENGNVTKNGHPIITSLKDFKIQMTDNKVTISMSANNTPNNPQTTLSTTIYIRK
ncbi:PilW family protein [Bacillus sp. FJAT-27445]|uniref:PilW family protein n=1 Tax=Bacillus sp. FJAT-27445 TaxID=1679166 RepID=UPI0007435C3E|nr:prepilin-type N-terminal cleavage/methylation domain-containing protein [Bacillus sp. FJAT-27445]